MSADLRNDDDQAGVQALSGVELPKVAGIVGHKGEVFGDDPGHQIPVSLAAQTQPIDMKAVVAMVLCHGHERCVQAFIDEELHEVVPEDFRSLTSASGRRFTDFNFNPCSDSFLGRPRAG